MFFLFCCTLNLLSADENQCSTLDDVARLRAASEYLPQGPLFMMPPTALKAMSFSDAPSAVNEAVTVGIRLDPKTGGVASSRVMLTALPPVISLTIDQADRCSCSYSCSCSWCYVLPLLCVFDVLTSDTCGTRVVLSSLYCPERRGPVFYVLCVLFVSAPCAASVPSDCCCCVSRAMRLAWCRYRVLSTYMRVRVGGVLASPSLASHVSA